MCFKCKYYCPKIQNQGVGFKCKKMKNVKSSLKQKNKEKIREISFKCYS